MRTEIIGTWKTEDSTERVKISETTGGTVSVSSYDLSDGEVFEVSNLVVSTDSVEYDKLVPSNGYRTHEKLAIGQDGRLSGKLTVYEMWVKTIKGKGGE